MVESSSYIGALRRDSDCLGVASRRTVGLSCSSSWTVLSHETGRWTIESSLACVPIIDVVALASYRTVSRGSTCALLAIWTGQEG